MSVQELRLMGHLANDVRVNDDPEKPGCIVIHVDAGMNSMCATLDRGQQQMLLLYLQERLTK